MDGYALTADGNIVHARATLTYRIEDPVALRVRFRRTPPTRCRTRWTTPCSMPPPHFTVDDILTRDVTGFSETVRKRVIELVEQQNLGIVVEQCVVQSMPPRQLKEAFDERAQGRGEAQQGAERSPQLRKPGAEQGQRRRHSRASTPAESERARLVNECRSRGRAVSTSCCPNTKQNPDLFVQQRLTETLGRVLTNVQDKIFVPERPTGRPEELRLLLNREPPKPKPESPEPQPRRKHS